MENNYLSTSVCCKIEEVEDIGEIVKIESDCEFPKFENVIVGHIVRVMSCDYYAACPHCAMRDSCK